MAGKWGFLNESMYFLLKNGWIFQPATCDLPAVPSGYVRESGGKAAGKTDREIAGLKGSLRIH